jgi:hypothetical protein
VAGCFALGNELPGYIKSGEFFTGGRLSSQVRLLNEVIHSNLPHVCF